MNLFFEKGAANFGRLGQSRQPQDVNTNIPVGMNQTDLSIGLTTEVSGICENYFMTSLTGS